MTSSGTHTLDVRLTPGPDLGRLHLGFTRAGARPRHCGFFFRSSAGEASDCHPEDDWSPKMGGNTFL